MHWKSTSGGYCESSDVDDAWSQSFYPPRVRVGMGLQSFTNFDDHYFVAIYREPFTATADQLWALLSTGTLRGRPCHGCGGFTGRAPQALYCADCSGRRARQRAKTRSGASDLAVASTHAQSQTHAVKLRTQYP